MEDRHEIFVGGKWARATGEATELISPYTEEPTARVTGASISDVDRAVAAARNAFDDGPWPRLAPADRVEAVHRLLDVYQRRARDMATVISTEMGAPITFATRAQVGLPLAMSRALC